MRLREELRERLGVEAEIRPGWPAQFLVLADGKAVFSYWKERRLPKPGEVAGRLEQAVMTEDD